MKRQLYIFDIDGTLISSGGVGRRAMESAIVSRYGIENAFDGYHFHGKTDPLIIRDMLERHGLQQPSDAVIDEVLDDYIQELRRMVPDARNYRVLPGVTQALDTLSERACVRLGLATGNLRLGAAIKLESCGLWDYFTFGGFASDSGEREELTRLAVERGRAQAEGPVDDADVFVIGDTPADVTCAHAAGAIAVGIATGRHTMDQLAQAGADRLYPSMVEFYAEMLG